MALTRPAWGMQCPQLLANNHSPHIKILSARVTTAADYTSFLRRDRRFFWSTVFHSRAPARTVPVFFMETESGLSVFLALPKEEAAAPLLSSLIGPVIRVAPEYVLEHHSNDTLSDEVRNGLNAGKDSAVVEIRGFSEDRGSAILSWLIKAGHLFRSAPVAHSGTSWIATVADAMKAQSTDREDFEVPGNWDWMTAPGRVLFWNQEKTQNETIPIVLRKKGDAFHIYTPAKDKKDAEGIYLFIRKSERRTLASRGQAYLTFMPTSRMAFLEPSEVPDDIRKLLPVGPMIEIICDTPSLMFDGIIGSRDGSLSGTVGE